MTIKHGAIVLLAAVALACGTFAAPASATVVTFDDLSGSGQVADGYGGITWGNQWTYYDGAQSPYNPESLFERVFPTGDGPVGSFSFSTPTVFDGAFFSGYNSTNVTFTGYGSSNNLLFTSGSLTPSSTPTWLASGYSGLVSKITVSSPTDLWIMDNVTYEGKATTVPEPSQTAVLGFGVLGLAGLMAFARKRSAKSAA